MRISETAKTIFKGNIIDVHTHRGSENSLWNSRKFPTAELDNFIKEPLTISINGRIQIDNVKRILVSSIDGLAWSKEQELERAVKGIKKNDLKPEELIFAKDEITSNLDMINKYKEDKFFAVMAVCQPSKTGGSAKNIKKLLKEYPNSICGLKFHPQGLLLNADSSLYDDYLRFAETNKLPCLFHSEVNVNYKKNILQEHLNYADPDYIYKLAQRHPKVPVIMGHMGAGHELSHKKAIKVLEKSIRENNAKLFVDISWVDFSNDLPVAYAKSIIEVINKMKELNALDRILFGTDAPLGCYGEPERLAITQKTPKEAYELTISRIKTAIKNEYGAEADSIIDKIFYENANELFFEKKWAGKGYSKNPVLKRILIVSGSIAGMCGVGLLCKSLFSSQRTTNIDINTRQ